MEVTSVPTRGRVAPLCVLHVDDAPAERYRRRRMLERAGFSVVDAESGVIAVEKVASGPVDVALIDVRLPDITGYDLVQRIKDEALHDGRDVAVVLISRYFTDSEARVKGLESGADACLAEPVSDAELVATLRAVGRTLRQLRQAHQLESGLVRQAADLRDADRAKNDFLASVVHELRQPIQAIVYATAVMRTRKDRRTGERARDLIERQAEQMASIAEELLDASKIVRGQVPITLQLEDLREIVRRALQTARPAVTQAEHALEVVFPEQPLPVRADSGRLQQVFLNILMNAVRYTPPHGRIVITFDVRDSEAAVHVSDSGAGIAEADLPRIFDLFTRATSEGPGFGIGLALARSIVEKHDGRIEARSAGIGCGSEFVVILPAAGENP